MVLVFFTSGLAAQGVDETCTIEGRITRAGESVPLRKSTVSLYRIASTLALLETGTDTDGHYCFVNVKPGEYRVAAEQAGYMRREYGAGKWQAQGTIFQLTERQRQTANIELYARGGIRGRVVDSDGDTVPTSHVAALRIIYRNGRREFTQAADTDCDENGEYKLANLPSGKYLVRAVSRVQPPPPKIPGRPVDAGETYGPTFFPSNLDVSSAAVVQVTTGNVVDGTNVDLRRGRLYRIRGRVQRPNGMSANGATVMLGEMSAGSVNFRQELVQTTKAPEGSFDFPGLWGGQYFVQVRDVAGSDLEGHAIANIDGRDMDFLNITLGESARLDGTISAPGQDLPNLNRFRVELDPVDGFFLGSPTGQIDANGLFRIPRIKPGRFAVTVQGLPQTAYVKSVRYGTQELDPQILDVRTGVAGRLDIILSNRAAIIDGQVQASDGKPISRAAICLIPENQRTTAYRTSISNDDGTYRLSGIIPGRYLIVAVSDLEPGGEQEPEFLTRFGTQATRIEIAEGASPNIRLTVVNQ